MNVCENDGGQGVSIQSGLDGGNNTTTSSSSAHLHQIQRSTSSNDTTFDLLLADRNSNNVNLNDIDLTFP